MMKGRWLIVGLIAFGLVAALCAAGLTVFLRMESHQKNNQVAASVDTTYVCAAKPLPAMTVITEEAVVTRTVPQKEAPTGGLANPAQVLGKVLVTPMVTGQPFTAGSFVAEGSGPEMASAIPSGMRAVTLSLPEDGGMKDLLYPGSLVDVVVLFDLPSDHSAGGRALASTILVQGVEVLAVDDKTTFSPRSQASDGGASAALQAVQHNERRLVTLLTTPAQARSLRLAMQHGFVSLAMRNPMDQTPPDSGLTLISDLLDSSAFSPGPASLPASDHLAQADPAGQMEKPGSLAPARWEVLILRAGASETKTFDPLSVKLNPVEP